MGKPPVPGCHWHLKAQTAFTSPVVSGHYPLAPIWSFLLAEKEELNDIASQGPPHLWVLFVCFLFLFYKRLFPKPGTLWRQTLEQERNCNTNFTKVCLRVNEGLASLWLNAHIGINVHTFYCVPNPMLSLNLKKKISF
jgi:hypothetical protein